MVVTTIDRVQKMTKNLDEILAYGEKCFYIEKRRGMLYMNRFIIQKCNDYKETHDRNELTPNQFMDKQLGYIYEEVSKLYTRVKNGERN